MELPSPINILPLRCGVLLLSPNGGQLKCIIQRCETGKIYKLKMRFLENQKDKATMHNVAAEP